LDGGGRTKPCWSSRGAYNVEMGITNELFQQRAGARPNCQFVTLPNDVTDTNVPTTPAAERESKSSPLPAIPGAAHPVYRHPWWRVIDQPGSQALRDRRLRALSTPMLTTGNSTVADAEKPGRQTCFRTSWCTPWDRAWPTISCRAGPRATSSGTAPLWGLGQRASSPARLGGHGSPQAIQGQRARETRRSTVGGERGRRHTSKPAQ